jgi:hypothetical protein
MQVQVTSVLYWGRRNSHFTLDPCGFLLTRDLPGAFLVSYAGACYSSLRAGKCPNMEILNYFADRSKRNFFTCDLQGRSSEGSISSGPTTVSLAPFKQQAWNDQILLEGAFGCMCRAASDP